MARLLLVRHGQASAGWGADGDPGLSALGIAQAESAADRLDELLGDRRAALRTSPLRRARETAAPAARRWGRSATVSAAFGEIPSPTDDLAERAAWLPGALAGRWGDLDERVARWREHLIAAALATELDTVAFTHFVAINALVGAAAGSEDVTTFLPANASITELAVHDGSLEVVILGSEAAPEVG